MATFVLLNNIQIGQHRKYAGVIIDDAQEDTSAITSAGGKLFATGNATVDAAATKARELKARGGDPNVMEGLVNAAVDAVQQATADAAVPIASVQFANVTLVAGAATENTLVYTANSVVIPVRETEAGTPGALTTGTITPGGAGVGSAVINSAEGADVSVVKVIVLG